MKPIILYNVRWFTVLLLLVSFISVPFTLVQGQSSQPVYVIPVEQTIEQGLESFLQRAFVEAESFAAKEIILDIDTYGGSVDAAEGIGKLIRNSPIPVTAFVQGNAASAGAYIALNADRILMSPGSSLGAAAVRDIQGQEVDPKITSYWASKMKSAAELNGRDPKIAQAMVDPKITIPGVKEDDDRPLTLTATEAEKVGYAEGVVADIQGVLNFIGAAEQPVEHVSLTPAEQLARWVTHPYIMPILLIVGLAGIAFEMIIPGFGFPGIIGLISLATFFFGHYVAGFAGIEHVILFVGGIILMLIELFVPGFGIFGAIGIGSLILGIVLASYDTTYGLVSLGIAFVVTIVVLALGIKYLGHRGTWNRFILKDELNKESGYIANKTREELVGKIGKSVTPLRPSGTILIEGERIDAVTEGGFIQSNVSIQVVKVEWNRVIVRPVEGNNQ